MPTQNYVSFLSYILPYKFDYRIRTQAMVMAAGMLYGGWSPFYVVIAYFLETIIIGLIHVVKMQTVLQKGHARKEAVMLNKFENMNHWGAILFFMFHYFFFIAIQSIFAFVLFDKYLPTDNEAFGLIDNYTWLFSQHEFELIFGILAVSHIGIALREWFIPEKYHTYTLKNLFMQPYIRILVQQFVVILAGFFFILSTEGYAAALLVIGLRVLSDTLLIGVKQSTLLKEKLVKHMLKNDGVKEKEIREQLDALLDF